MNIKLSGIKTKGSLKSIEIEKVSKVLIELLDKLNYLKKINENKEEINFSLFNPFLFF